MDYYDKVVELDDHRPHKVSEVICINCKKRWIAVRPEEAPLKKLQCPGCGEVGYVIETGEEIE